MEHHNTTIADDAQRLFNFKAGESLGEVADFIQPTFEIEHKCNIVRSFGLTNATQLTLYTTPSDKDFYLRSLSLGVIKDVTSTSTLTDIRTLIEGVTRTLLAIPGISLTADSQNITISFRVPLKIDRGVGITLNNSTNVANITSYATVTGNTVETTKGV